MSLPIYRQVAGQLLGFVGMDGKGLEGIERSFDEQLGGLSVRQAVRRDASGREFYVNSNYEAQPAEDAEVPVSGEVFCETPPMRTFSFGVEVNF